MPQIIIHLTDVEFRKVQEALQYNGKTDLENETFSGTEINVAMSPYGNFLTLKGYQQCEIENVSVEFNNKMQSKIF